MGGHILEFEFRVYSRNGVLGLGILELGAQGLTVLPGPVTF